MLSVSDFALRLCHYNDITLDLVREAKAYDLYICKVVCNESTNRASIWEVARLEDRLVWNKLIEGDYSGYLRLLRLAISDEFDISTSEYRTLNGHFGCVYKLSERKEEFT